MTYEEAATICVDVAKRLRRLGSPNMEAAPGSEDLDKRRWVANNGSGVFFVESAPGESSNLRPFSRAIGWDANEREDLGDSVDDAFLRLALNYWIYSVVKAVSVRFPRLKTYKEGMAIETPSGRMVFSRLSDEDVRVDIWKHGEITAGLPFGNVLHIHDHAPSKVAKAFLDYVER